MEHLTDNNQTVRATLDSIKEFENEPNWTMYEITSSPWIKVLLLRLNYAKYYKVTSSNYAKYSENILIRNTL